MKYLVFLFSINCMASPVVIFPYKGGVAITYPVKESDVNSIKEKHPGSIVVDSSALPKDREYRAAWKIVQSGLEVDLEKAKEIHKNKMQKEAHLEVQKINKKIEDAEDSVDAVELKRLKIERKNIKTASNVDLSGVTSLQELKDKKIK